MKYYYRVTILMIFIFSCTQNKSLKCVENFDEFYKKMSTDSVFQKSRILFPLKAFESIDDYEQDNKKEKFIENIIESGSWSFNRFDKNKFIIKINKNNNDYVINFQIVDTGFYLDYYYKIKNKKWYLYKIVDTST